MGISEMLDYWWELYQDCEGDLTVFKERYPYWHKRFYITEYIKNIKDNI